MAQWKQYVIVQLYINSLYLGFHKQKVDTVIQVVEKHGFQKNSGHFIKLVGQIGHSHLLY